MAILYFTRLSDRQRRLAGWVINSMKDVYPKEFLPVLTPARLEIPLDGYKLKDKFERLPVLYFMDRLDALHDDTAHLSQTNEQRRDGLSALNLANQVRIKYRHAGRRI